MKKSEDKYKKKETNFLIYLIELGLIFAIIYTTIIFIWFMMTHPTLEHHDRDMTLNHDELEIYKLSKNQNICLTDRI